MGSRGKLRTTSLTPVLELEPMRFTDHDRPSPDGSARENPEGWLRYWQDCLADAGLKNVQPVVPGSFLVPVKELKDPAVLAAVLRPGLPELGAVPLDEIALLSGGYVLSCTDALLLPGCCSDLGDLREWEAASEYADAGWTDIWTGHPWVSVRAHGEIIELAGPIGDDPPLAPATPQSLATLRRAELGEAVAGARRQAIEFAVHLIRALQAEGVPDADLRADALLGGLVSENLNRGCADGDT